MPTAVISAEKFRRMQAHGYAGYASELADETVRAFRAAGGWDGQHWHMHSDGDRGTVLSPVNVRA